MHDDNAEMQGPRMNIHTHAAKERGENGGLRFVYLMAVLVRRQKACNAQPPTIISAKSSYYYP
jgi:hypothetical protein